MIESERKLKNSLFEFIIHFDSGWALLVDGSRKKAYWYFGLSRKEYYNVNSMCRKAKKSGKTGWVYNYLRQYSRKEMVTV